MAYRLPGPLVLCVALGAAMGCVVPVGPEWTDPQGNYPPTITSASPPIGSVLSMDPDGGEPLAVEVDLADQNTQDQLYVRWIIDYPPYVEGQSHIALPLILPGGQQIDRSPILFTPNCMDDQIARRMSDHRLLLAVSDRPFAPEGPSQGDLVLVQKGNFLVEAAWQFEIDCP